MSRENDILKLEQLDRLLTNSDDSPVLQEAHEEWEAAATRLMTVKQLVRWDFLCDSPAGAKASQADCRRHALKILKEQAP